MSKQIKLIKTVAENLAENKSEKFMELYFDFIEFFNDYFEEQAIEYIKSLEDYPEIKINLNKLSFLEKLMKKLEQIFNLGSDEADEEINTDLLKIGVTNNGFQTISNEYALEYAENQAGYLLSQVNETTQNNINSIITNGIKESQTLKEIAGQIKDKFANYTLYRSTLISTMEVSQAYGQGQKRIYDEYEEELGVIGFKRSVTQKDSNVRESHKVNEEAGWIRRDKVYPGTGTMNAPHGFLCRCHDINSMTNPDTGMLYDEVSEYKEEQINEFSKNWGDLEELEMNLSIKEKELAGNYNLLAEEIFALKTFSSEGYIKYNDGYKKASSDLMFQSGISFFMGGLNKLPKYEGKVFRGHKVKKKEFENLASFKNGDIFSYNTFFSSSRSKKIAEGFMGDDYKVLFDIKTKKGLNIEEFSLYKKEKEVIFFPKTLFRIDKVEKDGKNLKIKLIDL